jgi:serine/threonine-protein kinase
VADSIYFEIGQSIRSATGAWYRAVQHLGTGGNAVTYLVLSTSGRNEGVLFALKVFRKLSEPTRRERFLSEVMFLEGCNHPALMHVFDSGVFAASGNEFPFVVAEYLPLRLFDVIRAGDATTAHKVAYALQLLSALTYLQSSNPKVVHRDIKPQNVFVKGRSCVLGDFGLMKLLDGQVEQDREIFKESVGPGMPFYYRTPDLIAYARNESDITTRSDVFQLGLVLTELFTGRNPAKRPDDYLDPLELENIGTIPGGLGGSIATLLHRMLTIDPAQRPDASALLDPWQGVFRSATERAHALDGKVI